VPPSLFVVAIAESVEMLQGEREMYIS